MLAMSIVDPGTTNYNANESMNAAQKWLREERPARIWPRKSGADLGALNCCNKAEHVAAAET